MITIRMMIHLLKVETSDTINWLLSAESEATWSSTGTGQVKDLEKQCQVLMKKVPKKDNSKQNLWKLQIFFWFFLRKINLFPLSDLLGKYLLYTNKSQEIFSSTRILLYWLFFMPVSISLEWRPGRKFLHLNPLDVKPKSDLLIFAGPWLL